MALLDAPALQLRMETKDALGILEGILQEKHWRDFELANLSLFYVPYWFFNYDVYRETEGHSESFSSQMCMNAIDGELEPMIAQITKEIPVERSKDILHGTAYKVERATVQKKEVKEIAAIKVAGQIGIPKENVTISGVSLVYIPIYRIWVTLSAGYRRVELDGVSGSPLNIGEVPERERGVMEVTRDMLEDLKRPEGWVDYSKKAFNWGLGVSTAMSHRAAGGVGSSFSAGGLMHWLFTTKYGRYTLFAIIILLLFILLIMKNQSSVPT
ncbi:hypothetical protein K8R43_00085 [archaeon]|nr:hypothetical protein [archaeon]